MVRDWLQQVILAQQGDLAAFDRVVKQFEDMAVGYAYSLLGDFQLAEDAAQEAFVEAYFCLENLNLPVAFPAWFRKIVFKQCDRIRRRKQLITIPLESTAELPTFEQTPDEVVTKKETHDAVLSAINALPEMERTVTSLAYINGYSLAEVGDFLEVPVSTVKNRLHTARKQLKERMAGLLEETLKSHAPDDDFSRNVRAVLQGTRVGFYDGQSTPEDLMFPGVMRAIAEYLGNGCGFPGMVDPVSMWRWEAYAYMAAVTGTSFRFVWKHTKMTTLIDIAYLSQNYLDMFRNAFDALGLTGEFLLSQEYADRFAGGKHTADTATIRNRIKESIAVRRMPVVVMGVFGPPEPCIVTGYDDDGDTLIGWDHFQADPEVKLDPRVSFEPSGCFRLRDWANDVHGIYVITGTKPPAPDRSQVVRTALERGISMLRVRNAGGYAVGTASIESWIEDIKHADELDDAALTELYENHTKATWDLAERRALAENFMRHLDVPILCVEAQPDLSSAADMMIAIHDIMYEVAEKTKRAENVFDGDPQKLRDPEIRRGVINRLSMALTMDKRAADHIDRVLAVLHSETPSYVETKPDLALRVVLLSHAQPEVHDLPPTPERASLPRLVRSLLEFNGQNLGYRTIDGQQRLSNAYAFFAGVSGEAFHHRDSILQMDAAAFTRVFDRAFSAAGYDYRFVLTGGLAELGLDGIKYGWDDNLRRLILRHIRDCNRPVFLFHKDEARLIIGYSHHAQMLLGYGGSNDTDTCWQPVDSGENQMKEEFFPFVPPAGPHPWAVFVGEPHEKPEIADIYRQALADAAGDLLTAKASVIGADGEQVVTDTPYESLVAMLKTDVLFPAGDAEILASRLRPVASFFTEIGERRRCAVEFLRMAAEHIQEDSLLVTAALFEQIAEDAFSARHIFCSPERIGDLGVRNDIARLLGRIEDIERQAADMLSTISAK